MILIRQKIFFDYSKYTTEEAAKIRAERNAQAARVMADRKAALGRMNNSNEISRKGFDAEIQQVNDLGFGKRTQSAMKQSIITQHQKNVNTNMQARNAEYERILKDNDKWKKKLNRQYKPSRESTMKNPNSNPYDTSILGNTYRTRKPVANPTPKTTTNIVQPQQQKQGIGTMGKVAIGAGVAGTAYGAYRLIKARKQKQQEEGDENTPQNK